MGPAARLRPLGAAFLAVVALGALVALVAWRSSSGEDDPPPDALRQLAREIAEPWPALQEKPGWYRDYIYGGRRSFCGRKLCRARLGNARYGESLLGYGLIQTGLRERDERLVASGLRAITYMVRKPGLQKALPTAFEGLAVASAYNLMRARDPQNPLFARNRRGWERWLRRQPPTSTIYFNPDTPRFGNHYLVEAIEVLELLRTGLRSRDRKAILGPNRRRHAAITRFLLMQRIPDMARRYAVPARGRRAWLFSDPPDHPLAYYGLSTGLYARAASLLPPDQRRRTRSALLLAANASLWLAAPDGAMAYYGRSQEQSWAYAGLILAEQAAANAAAARSRDPGRYLGVADRALARLRSDYGNGPEGWRIVPAAREVRRPLLGLDRYTGAVAFSGLTLVALNWALDERARGGARAAQPRRAVPRGAVALSRGESRFGIVRTRDVWFAVKRQSSTKRGNDLRYDFGLTALKVRAGDRWVTVTRERPKTSTPDDSAGPVLADRNKVGQPRGKRLDAVGRTIVVEGGYRTRDRKWLRRGVRWVYRPIRCGVVLTFPARAGDVYEYSQFFRADARRPRLRGRTLLGGTSRTTFAVRPLAMRLRGGYASSVDPKLIRARVTVVSPWTGDFSIQTCRR